MYCLPLLPLSDCPSYISVRAIGHSNCQFANSPTRQFRVCASISRLACATPDSQTVTHLRAIEGFAQHLVPVFLKAQSSPAVFRCILGLWRIPLVQSLKGLKRHSLESWHGRLLCTYSTWVDLLYLIYATCGFFIPFQNKILQGWTLILEIKKRRLWCWLQSFEKVAKKFTSRILGPKLSHTASNKSCKNYIQYFLTFLPLTFVYDFLSFFQRIRIQLKIVFNNMIMNFLS